MPSPPNQIYWNSEWRTAREICLGIASSNGWARLHQIAAARGGDGHCKKVQLQQLRLVHIVHAVRLDGLICRNSAMQPWTHAGGH